MTQAVVSRQQAGSAAFVVLAAISFCHLLNDLVVSLLPAIYPILKSAFDLSFGQIGLITLVLQGVASLLQPLVGLYTDRKPQPYSLVYGMGCTLLGICLLAYAPNFLALLAGAALLGLGASIFHPEASRLARLASGGAHGMAQSLFQLGGSFGSSIGPVLAAFIVLPHGQSSLAWFAFVALGAMVILIMLGNWYRNGGHATPKSRSANIPAAVLPQSQVRRAIAVLIALVFSKYFYLSSITSYYIFYLMHRFALPHGYGADLSVRVSGSGGRRHIHRRPDRRPLRPQSRDLGFDPRCAALYAGAALCRARGDGGFERADRSHPVVGILGDRRLCAGAYARTSRHGLGPVLRRGLRHGGRRCRGLGRACRLDQHRIRLPGLRLAAPSGPAGGAAALCRLRIPSLINGF